MTGLPGKPVLLPSASATSYDDVVYGEFCGFLIDFLKEMFYHRFHTGTVLGPQGLHDIS